MVPQFITQALRHEPLTVYGEGTQTRSFCYVDDLIDGLLALFERSGHHTPVNLGNPQPVSMIDLAHEVIQLTESKSTVSHKPLPLDDPLMREPDIRLAADILGWKPRVERTAGLVATIADIRARA